MSWRRHVAPETRPTDPSTKGLHKLLSLKALFERQSACPAALLLPVHPLHACPWPSCLPAQVHAECVGCRRPEDAAPLLAQLL